MIKKKKGRKKAIVTVNTDAGFWTHHKVGSFAFWIKGDGLFLKGSGIFKDKIMNSWEAEMKAIINALSIIDKSGYTNIEKLIINRDNINAVSGKNSDNELKRHLSLMISRLRKKSGYLGTDPFFEFRHVKAHTDIKDSRSFVNDWCDKAAKEELQKWAIANNIPKYEKKSNDTQSAKRQSAA